MKLYSITERDKTIQLLAVLPIQFIYASTTVA